jgi:hypothetical protein
MIFMAVKKNQSFFLYLIKKLVGFQRGFMSLRYTVTMTLMIEQSSGQDSNEDTRNTFCIDDKTLNLFCKSKLPVPNYIKFVSTLIVSSLYKRFFCL